MKKSEYMERHGLTIRRVTSEDRAAARTDYQRYADFIISNGACEWFSANGSLRDMQLFVREWKAACI